MQAEHIYVRSSEADSVQFCSTEWIRRDVRCCLLAVFRIQVMTFQDITCVEHAFDNSHSHAKSKLFASQRCAVLSCARVFVEPPHTHIALTPESTLPSCCVSHSHHIRFSEHSLRWMRWIYTQLENELAHLVRWSMWVWGWASEKHIIYERDMSELTSDKNV